jgi:hypothetical protein
MARTGSVRKPILPQVNIGLATIPAQSPVVEEAFGQGLGFVLMVLALMVSLTLGVITAGVASRAIMHVFGL